MGLITSYRPRGVTTEAIDKMPAANFLIVDHDFTDRGTLPPAIESVRNIIGQYEPCSSLERILLKKQMVNIRYTCSDQAIPYHPAAELLSLSDPAMRRDVRSGINARPVLCK